MSFVRSEQGIHFLVLAKDMEYIFFNFSSKLAFFPQGKCTEDPTLEQINWNMFLRFIFFSGLFLLCFSEIYSLIYNPNSFLHFREYTYLAFIYIHIEYLPRGRGG